MMNLSRRSTQSEAMDDAALDPAVYQRCINDLAAVNRVTMTHRPTLRWLAHATREFPQGASISVLDVAYGQGDLLRAIGRWAAARGLRAQLSGIDLNPRSAMAARAATPPALTPDATIDYRTGDVFDYMPDPRPDFIVTSQFTHHLTDEQLVVLLRWLDRFAVRGWHITDLHRHLVPYYAFRWIVRAARWHRIVGDDGTISIARGFRREDWVRLLAEAGVQANIVWHVPFRYSISALR